MCCYCLSRFRSHQPFKVCAQTFTEVTLSIKTVQIIVPIILFHRLSQLCLFLQNTETHNVYVLTISDVCGCTVPVLYNGCSVPIAFSCSVAAISVALFQNFLVVLLRPFWLLCSDPFQLFCFCSFRCPVRPFRVFCFDPLLLFCSNALWSCLLLRITARSY